MPFREVIGSVMSEPYAAIAVEVKALPCLNNASPEPDCFKAVGINSAVKTAPWWAGVQRRLRQGKSIPKNGIITAMLAPAAFPSIILIFRSNDADISEIKDIYQKIMEYAKKNGIQRIAIPLIGGGGSDISKNRFFRLIAEDSLISYFMTSDSRIKADLFTSYDSEKPEVRLLPQRYDEYMDSVCRELGKKDRALFKIFPTWEKLNRIWYNYEFEERMPKAYQKHMAYNPVPDEYLPYEAAARAFEAGKLPEIVPNGIRLRKRSFAAKTEKVNDINLFDEEKADKLKDEYCEKLCEELNKSGKNEIDFYHSRLCSYIINCASEKDIPYSKLAGKSGLRRDTISKILSGTIKTSNSPKRVIALAAVLASSSYDFYVCAVCMGRNHNFPSDTFEKHAWRCYVSGFTDIKALDKELKSFSSDFALLPNKEKSGLPRQK